MLIWIVLALLIIIAIVVRANIARVTIFEFQRGLRYRRGRFLGVLDPGSYLTVRKRDVVQTVDVRPRTVSLAGQEILSADGVPFRVSLAVVYDVVDPATMVNDHVMAEQMLYVAVQLAAREVLSAEPIEDLLASRNAFGPRLADAAREQIESLGLRLLTLDVKDLMLPGELKAIFTEVVRARQEGLAALERARGESAAMRNLANAASAVRDNPALLQLRLIQTLGSMQGNTLVLGAPLDRA